MQIELTELNDHKVSVKFEADEQEVQNKIEEVVQYFKQGPIPGFRPGKATPEAIKFHLKSKIEEVAKMELAQNAFFSTIAEKNIKPFGQPEFTSIHLEGNKFKCDFCFNKVPNIELQQYKGFDLPKGTIPSAVEMAEKVLQELRVRNGDTVPFTEDDFVQEGDNTIINYEACDPVNPDIILMKKDGEMFVVGRAQIEAFNENMLGMRLGEKREFPGLIPAEIVSKYANKNLRFTVELVMASKAHPSPLDNSLAEKVGAKDINNLIAMANGMASTRVQELEKRYLVDQIAARLIEGHVFDVPRWLMAHEATLLAKQYGLNWETADDAIKSNLLEVAAKNVKLSLIMDKVRETEPEAQLTDEEVLKIIQQNLTQYRETIQGLQGKTDEEVFKIIKQSGFLGSLVTNIRDDFAMDFIIKNSNIIE